MKNRAGATGHRAHPNGRSTPPKQTNGAPAGIDDRAAHARSCSGAVSPRPLIPHPCRLSAGRALRGNSGDPPDPRAGHPVGALHAQRRDRSPPAIEYTPAADPLPRPARIRREGVDRGTRARGGKPARAGSRIARKALSLARGAPRTSRYATRCTALSADLTAAAARNPGEDPGGPSHPAGADPGKASSCTRFACRNHRAHQRSARESAKWREEDDERTLSRPRAKLPPERNACRRDDRVTSMSAALPAPPGAHHRRAGRHRTRHYADLGLAPPRRARRCRRSMCSPIPDLLARRARTLGLDVPIARRRRRRRPARPSRSALPVVALGVTVTAAARPPGRLQRAGRDRRRSAAPSPACPPWPGALALVTAPIMKDVLYRAGLPPSRPHRVPRRGSPPVH